MKEKIIALKGYVRNCLTGYKESKEKVQKKYVIEDLKKAIWYINREIQNLEKE